MAHHLGLDFHLVEILARVDSNNATNHLWDDEHVTQMRLDLFGLLVGLGLRLGLAELLDQTHWLSLQPTVEPSSCTSMNNIAELVRGEVEESAPVF
jgi:hypothetical protein